MADPQLEYDLVGLPGSTALSRGQSAEIELVGVGKHVVRFQVVAAIFDRFFTA
jgi:hypothetical protein